MNDEDITTQDRTLVRKRTAANFATYLAGFLIFTYMLVTSAVTTWNAITATQTRSTLLDCVTAEGTCNAENQAATGAIVQQIVDEIITTRHVSVLAAACSTDPTVVTPDMVKEDRIEAIDRCVQKQLVRERIEREKNSSD